MLTNNWTLFNFMHADVFCKNCALMCLILKPLKNDTSTLTKRLNNCLVWKKGLWSFVIIEMQVKTMLSYHFAFTRMAGTKMTDNVKSWWRHGATGILRCCWGKTKWYNNFGKVVWKFPINKQYDPKIPLRYFY